MEKIDQLEEYPVIKKIKRRLKKNEKIKMHQYYDYERRLTKSPLLMIHVELLQEEKNRSDRLQKKLNDYRYDTDNQISILNGKLEWADKVTKEYYGERSFGYLVAFKNKDRLQAQIEQSNKKIKSSS
tara:strand:- start:386 stop:766 length:381 start_codon:yes stop_codon:yes gene_type:complete